MGSNVVDAADRFRAIDSAYEGVIGGSGSGGGGMENRLTVVEQKVSTLETTLDRIER